jgi:hypothetical protein
MADDFQNTQRAARFAGVEKVGVFTFRGINW